jgi:hypothetical protein
VSQAVSVSHSVCLSVSLSVCLSAIAFVVYLLAKYDDDLETDFQDAQK